jgi:methylmalonyl-CoA/ethylmalonyl-CoA epimerase
VRARHFVIGLVCAAASIAAPVAAQEAGSANPKLADIPIHHVGVLVRDLDKAAKAYAELLGVPVPAAKMQTGVTFPADYKGDRKAHLKTAFFQLNGVGVEMSQPMGGASPWREHLEKYGEGLHHIALHGVPDVAAATALAVSKGGKQIVGGPGSKMTAVDLRPLLGFTLELSAEPAAPAPAAAAEATKFADNTVRYVSVIVPDIQKSLAVFTELMGVQMPKTNDVKIAYPVDFTGDRASGPTLGMVALSGIDVAFTAPYGGGKTPWSDSVAKTGPAIHHLGIAVKGQAEHIAKFEKMGAKLIIGAGDLGYSWMDFYPAGLPLIFELNGMLMRATPRGRPSVRKAGPAPVPAYLLGAKYPGRVCTRPFPSFRRTVSARHLPSFEASDDTYPRRYKCRTSVLMSR